MKQFNLVDYSLWKGIKPNLSLCISSSSSWNFITKQSTELFEYEPQNVEDLGKRRRREFGIVIKEVFNDVLDMLVDGNEDGFF